MVCDFTGVSSIAYNQCPRGCFNGRLGTFIKIAMPQDHDGQPVGSVDVTIQDVSETPVALDRTRRSINVPMLGCSRFAAQSVKGY